MTSDSVAARLAREVNRQATADEIRRYLDAPVTEDERRDVLALVAWFRRRYPDPLERLRYVTRAYARWRPARPGSGPAVTPRLD